MSIGKILIISDSMLIRQHLTTYITSAVDVDLMKISADQYNLNYLLTHSPDIVILDIDMNNTHKNNGLSILQDIEDNISFTDKPFIIIYSSRAHYDDPNFQKAIDFGFCDFVLKTESTDASTITPYLKKNLLPKILSGIQAKQTRAVLHGHTPKSPVTIKKDPTTEADNSYLTDTSTLEGLQNLNKVLEKKPIDPKLLIIGASTGGPQVVQSIIQHITYRISVPIVIIQHMPSTFTQSFAKQLEDIAKIPVHELRHNMTLEAGHAYVFPGGTHGRLNAFGHLYVYYVDRNNYDAHPFKPSIDVAINHLKQSFNGDVIGVILSGMGSDGAKGMKLLHDSGSLIFAQDKLSSIVWGMPYSTIKEHAVDLVLNQDDLGVGILKALQYYGLHP